MLRSKKLYSMDREKYKSSVNKLEELPAPMPLYEEIKQGNVDFLIEAFGRRKEILLAHIRKGSSRQNVIRWQACVEAIESACHLLNKYKSQ